MPVKGLISYSDRKNELERLQGIISFTQSFSDVWIKTLVWSEDLFSRMIMGPACRQRLWCQGLSCFINRSRPIIIIITRHSLVERRARYLLPAIR